MNYFKVTLEYDGAAYHGWQVQPRQETIQGVLEEALHRLLGEAVRVTAAGRTDAGVHALGQVVSFCTAKERGSQELHKGLNALLPRNVAVRAVEQTDADFDARRSARGKLYRYRIWNAANRSIFPGHHAWWIRRPLDEEAMRLAAGGLLGEHDFSAFRAADCPAKSTVRILRRLELRSEKAPLLTFEVEATAFLKHMVRNLVGTLVEVGEGKRSPESMRDLLESRDRTRAGRTAPAHGLFLVEVYYP